MRGRYEKGRRFEYRVKRELELSIPLMGFGEPEVRAILSDILSFQFP